MFGWTQATGGLGEHDRETGDVESNDEMDETGVDGIELIGDSKSEPRCLGEVYTLMEGRG